MRKPTMDHPRKTCGNSQQQHKRAIRRIMATNPNLSPCGSRFEQLPKDLVMEILSRVSVKDLFNCRCVCTFWLSTISDPRFPHMHRSTLPIGILSQNIPRGAAGYSKHSRKAEFIQLQESTGGSEFQVQKMWFTSENNLPSYRFHMINSCNGLLCLCGINQNYTFYVCNPILGEYITLPPTKWPTQWRTVSGIGYSATTNEYKVLRTYCTKNKGFVSEIYTIGTGAWRSIGLASVPQTYLNVKLQCHSFLHGALHWITHTAESSIYSFDFETEQFRPIPLPRELSLPIPDLKLEVVGGCLLLCTSCNLTCKVDLWIMKDYDVQDSWTKIVVRAGVIELLIYSSFLVSLNNGDILVYNYGRVVCYIHDTNNLRETEVILTEEPIHDAIAYSPSFVSLYDLGEEVKRVQDIKKPERQLFAGVPPNKSLNSSVSCQLDFTLRTGIACATCGAKLGYVFRGKGFPMCQKCFDASSC